MAQAKCRYHENCEGHGLGGFEPTKTKQSFKEECDINEILKRAKNGQDITSQLNARIMQYGDVSRIPDYHTALNVITTAESMFMELDPNLRERFNNDPGEFLNFVQDDANRAEAEKLGLVAPKKGPGNPVPPVLAPTAPEATPAQPAVTNPPAQ